MNNLGEKEVFRGKNVKSTPKVLHLVLSMVLLIVIDMSKCTVIT